MIQFQEHTETGYALRTWENARLADLTIAFAVDFDTAGEKLTRKGAYGKYRSIDLNDSESKIRNDLQFLHLEIKAKSIKKLNIAGNGLYTFVKTGIGARNGKQWQNYLSAVLLSYLDHIVQGDKAISIRSGGQTGIDEAALKAGDQLGLETICLAPKHWLFRDETGKDIMSESLFLKRFGYDVIDLL